MHTHEEVHNLYELLTLKNTRYNYTYQTHC